MSLPKKILILIGVACILVAAIGIQAYTILKPASKENGEQKLVLTEPDTTVHHIKLTKDGFSPKNIVIRKDDKIIFSTELGVPFWPASNLHPLHAIYPDFDPKEAVNPDTTWEFTFSKAGRFKFHDHLFANYTGLIVVLTPEEVIAGASYTPTTDINECAKFSEQSQKQQCWDEQLAIVLEADGIDAAFDYFIKLYKTEPDIPKECHGWGHTLGEAAYDMYKQGEDLNLRPESSYCGYGYFHGFIGALIKDTGRVQDTREFCEYVAKELDGKLKGVRDNCIHGIGHGTASMLLEEGPQYHGDFMKASKKGVEICEMIYTELPDLENCYDGVFNELQLELFNSGYGMSYDEYMKLDDPFYYCSLQEERHKLACYYELTGMFWRIFDHDVVAMTRYALEHTEDLQNRGAKVVAKIAADQIQFDIVKTDHTKSIEACRIVPEFLYDACFGGILNGFIQHGEPGNLHQKGYAFCDEDLLSEAESQRCYEEFSGMVAWMYTEEQFKEACAYATERRPVKYCANYVPGM